MEARKVYDAVIIGGGLSGLFTGIALQKEGFKTLIIEKRSKPGGLCGSIYFNDREFIIACNDFGNAILRYFKQFSINQEFKTAKMKLYFGFGDIILPLKGSLLKVLKFFPDVIRLIKVAKGIKKGKYSYSYLGEIVQNHIKNENFRDLIYTTVYGAGTPPSLLRISDIVDTLFNKKYAYGYDETVYPVGGPGKMADNLLKHYKNVGGQIVLNTKFHKNKKLKGGFQQIFLEDGDVLYSKSLISSLGRLKNYPPFFRNGMKLSTWHLSIKNTIDFPQGIHTLAHMPKNIKKWFGDLHNGKLPREFGFHCVKSDVQNKKGEYSLTIYHYVPRGMNELSEKTKKYVKSYIISTLNKYLPNIKNFITFERYLDPSDFTAVHGGLSSSIFSKIIEGNFEKPNIYDETKDIYFIGNSVNPPGEHACGAILSGIKASEMVIKRLKHKCADRKKN